MGNEVGFVIRGLDSSWRQKRRRHIVDGILRELAMLEDGAGCCNWSRFYRSYAPDIILEVVIRECSILGIR